MKKNSSALPTRKLWPDIIRVIAIFLVIQVHLGADSDSLWSTTIKTCVPLFILLSGALLLEKQESYNDFFQKRISKVLIPWIFWTGVFVIYQYFSHHMQILANFFPPSIDIWYSWFTFFFVTFFSSFWFLPMLCSIYLIVPLLRIFIQKARSFDLIYLISLWFLFVSLFPFLFAHPLFPMYEPSLLLLPFQYLGYFIIGFYLIKKKPSKSLFRVSIFLILIGILPQLFISSEWELSERYTSSFLSPGVVFFSVGLFYLLFIVSNSLESRVPNFVQKIFTELSKSALGIYLIHQIVLESVGGIQLLPFDGVFTAVTVFFSSTIIVIVLRKLPLIRYTL